jgi:hypothetical protein
VQFCGAAVARLAIIGVENWIGGAPPFENTVRFRIAPGFRTNCRGHIAALQTGGGAIRPPVRRGGCGLPKRLNLQADNGLYPARPVV